MSGTAPQIILFDGECSFCAFWVRLILRHDRAARFRFAAYQSRTGRELCAERGLDPEMQASIALIGPEGLLSKSNAVIAILEQLGGAWRLVRMGRMVPRPWRDALYDFVARNRYCWFGKRIEHRAPSGMERERFLP